MVTFQRKHEAACVILLSDNQASCETADYDSFPIIVSYPPVGVKRFFKKVEYSIFLFTAQPSSIGHNAENDLWNQ